MNNVVKENDRAGDIDLLRICKSVLTRWWVVLLSALVFGCGIFTYSTYCLTPMYRSTTSIYILNQQDNNQVTYTDLQMSSQLTNDYDALIKSRSVMDAVIEKLGLDMTTQSLTKNVSVTVTSGTRIVNISVNDKNPNKAKEIVDCIREVASEQIVQIMSIDAVNLVDSGSLSLDPVSPNVKKNSLFGAVIGAVLACIILVLSEIMNDAIVTTDDVEKYLGYSVLGVVPNGNKKTSKDKYYDYSYGHTSKKENK